MNVPKLIALWILEFLTNMPQFVTLKTAQNSNRSQTIITNTGAPQGTVLAPILFSIYTNDCKSEFENIPILKYADDTAIQALIKTQNDLDNYHRVVDIFVQWCEEHFLQLNVKKTKEMFFDFRVKDNAHAPLSIGNETGERVGEYKYLGVVFDEKLN